MVRSLTRAGAERWLQKGDAACHAREQSWGSERHVSVMIARSQSAASLKHPGSEDWLDPPIRNSEGTSQGELDPNKGIQFWGAGNPKRPARRKSQTQADNLLMQRNSNALIARRV
uniref:Uncharacterized protein n=1 Tax=Trichuris muris TaxID=70415 RepID=A0A5S6Q8P1_TRIMR